MVVFANFMYPALLKSENILTLLKIVYIKVYNFCEL